MRVLQRHKKLIDTDPKIGLYNAYLLPHLDYCSIEWHYGGRRNSNKLEKLNCALFYNDVILVHMMTCWSA